MANKKKVDNGQHIVSVTNIDEGYVSLITEIVRKMAEDYTKWQRVELGLDKKPSNYTDILTDGMDAKFTLEQGDDWWLNAFQDSDGYTNQTHDEQGNKIMAIGEHTNNTAYFDLKKIKRMIDEELQAQVKRKGFALA